MGEIIPMVEGVQMLNVYMYKSQLLLSISLTVWDSLLLQDKSVNINRKNQNGQSPS